MSPIEDDISADDYLLVTVSISIPAMEMTENGETEIVDCLTLNLSCELDDVDYASATLSSMAEAISEGRLYGWMRQFEFEMRLQAGEIRKLTPTEEMRRHAPNCTTEDPYQ